MSKEMLLNLLVLVEICLNSVIKEDRSEGYYSGILRKKIQDSELTQMLKVLSRQIKELP